jgi:hypothetical protein
MVSIQLIANATARAIHSPPTIKSPRLREGTPMARRIPKMDRMMEYSGWACDITGLFKV